MPLNSSEYRICRRIAHEALDWVQALDSAQETELDRFGEWLAQNGLHEVAFIAASELTQVLYRNLLRRTANAFTETRA